MTSDEYLRNILYKYSNNGAISYNEQIVYDKISQVVRNGFYQLYEDMGYNGYSNIPTLDIKQSGSRAKGTAIKGHSDMDLFLSITDIEDVHTLKEYYDDLYNYMKNKGYSVRKQNVSIGLQYCGLSIDLVPARKVNSSSYQRMLERYNDHYLWSNKHQSRTLTNIQKHIDLVQSSHAKDVMMLTKIWRNQKGFDFPSIYIEIMVRDALSGFYDSGLEKRFIHVLKYIRDNIVMKKVVDPSNSNNIISDTLSLSEKMTIRNYAADAINAQTWSRVLN